MRSLSVTTTLVVGMLTTGCSLFDSAVACDEETPCPSGGVCGASGFCDDGTTTDGGGEQPVTRTATFTSLWSVTFFGSGNPRTDPEFMSFCIQGEFSTTNGNQKCAFGFDDDEIRATLEDATIIDTELSLTWDHWAVGASGTVVIGTHNTSAPPATFQDLDDVTVGRQDELFDEGEQKWVSVGTAVGEELRDGSTRGFVLGPAPDADQSWYGYALGASQTGPPELRVTYEVIEE
jgi:hypothetical protein